jgi:hypothetical protein
MKPQKPVIGCLYRGGEIYFRFQLETHKGEPMNLQTLSNNELLNQTKIKVSKERELTLEVLHLLREVEKRRFHLELGHGSLFEFCVRELGYSEAAASRRISAMRLIGEIPEVEEKIQAGTLSLSNVAQAQRFFQAEKKTDNAYSKEQKRDVIKTLENKSAREAQKELIKISPASVNPQERQRVVNVDRIEMRFTMGKDLQAKLERLKSLLSHKIPNPSFEALLEELTEVALQKLDPAEKKRCPPILRDAAATSRPAPHASRYIPKSVQRGIWKKDQGRCSYISAVTGRQCQSAFKLEIDHIIPRFHGGGTEAGNLRLLCSAHNKLVALQKIGPQIMTKYLHRPSRPNG